jgi:gibberellin A4 carboxyl methyltransferase
MGSSPVSPTETAPLAVEVRPYASRMSEAMAGGGVYDRQSAYQMRGATSHAALVADAARRVRPSSERDEVVIVDFGCAQGRVSNVLIKDAIEEIRRHHREIPVCVYHNDLLVNDWSGLFERLRGDDSYLQVAGGPITPLVSAVSFYEPVTPRGIVDLGMSFASVQWLSASGPAGTGSALYFDQLEDEPRRSMAAQAHADWTTFLERRVDELAPGGRLVLDMMGVDDTGVAAGHDAWRLVRAIAEDLVAEGAIDAHRLDAYVFPVYERTIDEVQRPFAEEVGTRARLEHCAIADVANPAADRFEEDGDASAFARDFVGFFRAFSEPSLRAALAPRDGALDELYRRLEDRIRADATDFTFVVHALAAVISRA